MTKWVFYQLWLILWLSFCVERHTVSYHNWPSDSKKLKSFLLPSSGHSDFCSSIRWPQLQIGRYCVRLHLKLIWNFPLGWNTCALLLVRTEKLEHRLLILYHQQWLPCAWEANSNGGVKHKKFRDYLLVILCLCSCQVPKIGV